MGLMQRHSTSVRESLPTRPETRWVFPGREARQTRCVGRRWRPYRHEGTGPAARPRMTPHSCCWSRSTSWRPMGRSTSGTFLLGWPRPCQRCGAPARAPRQRCGALWRPGELHATEGSSIGAAMRALPFGWATPVTAAAHRRELTGRLSRTTHGAPEAIISACVVAEMAAWAIEQHPVDAVVAAGLREAEDLARQYAVHPATVQPLRRAASGDWPPTTAEPTLDALATVASVLHVLREAKDLATALKRAVALGGDTDTTAAIVGGILGCQLEDVERQIPWISRVGMPDARLIEATAAGLYELRRSSQ